MNALFSFRHLLAAIVVLCAAFATARVTLAQERSPTERAEETGTSPQMKLSSQFSQPAGVALESRVDPENYYVGPSDVIAVNIWISPPVNFNLTVTPEGTLIIPTVGEVVVADLLLARVKEKVADAVRKKYIMGQVSVTLVRPRPIIVSVLGNVLNPGLYTLSAVDRSNRAIDEANKPNQKQTPEEIKAIISEMSTRDVLLRHKDGSQERVDITRFLATREDKWNPYLPRR